MRLPIDLLKHKQALFIFLGLIVLLIGLSGYFFFIKKSPQATAQQELQDTIIKVGKLIDLPNSETPVLATVADKSKLSGQAFFAKAENGDKVLIYSQSKKAYLYRPSLNKVIEFGSLELNQPQNTASIAGVQTSQEPVASPTATQAPIVVAIDNGTKTKGLANTVATKLQESLKTITIGSKENAKGNYDKTVLIDLTGNNSSYLNQLQGIVGGEVGTLPTGETKPHADILIVLGNDYTKKQ